MINNYSHDIATAFLAVSGLMLVVLSRIQERLTSAEGEAAFVRAYDVISRIARYSLAWILIAGVPRVIFYMQFEWSALAGSLQIIAIIVKHIVMFLLVGTGVHYWLKLNRKIAALKTRNS